MSFTPGFAPDAKSQWQSLDFDLQQFVLDEIERVASNPPPNGEYVLDPVREEGDIRQYVFVRVIVDGGRGTVTVVGIGTIARRK